MILFSMPLGGSHQSLPLPVWVPKWGRCRWMTAIFPRWVFETFSLVAGSFGYVFRSAEELSFDHGRYKWNKSWTALCSRYNLYTWIAMILIYILGGGGPCFWNLPSGKCPWHCLLYTMTSHKNTCVFSSLHNYFPQKYLLYMFLKFTIWKKKSQTLFTVH